MIVAIQHIRTLAIVLTLIAHTQYGLSQPSKNLIYFNSNIGQFWGGVELFFVVSGYLITGILIKALGDEKQNLNTKKIISNFYIKRATRILPSAIFWALFILGFSFLFPESKFGALEQNIPHFFASIFFYENIYLTQDVDFRYSVYWSLSIEEQFYFILPLLILLLRKHIFTFLVIAYIAQAILDRPVSQANLLFMIRYDALMLGSLIFFVFHQSWLKNIRKRELSSKLIITLLSLFLTGLITAPVLFRGFYPTTVTDLFAGLIVFTVIVYADQLNFAASRFSQASLWLAERSYTLYLSHKPCMFLAHLFSDVTQIDILPASILDLRWLIILALIIFASHLCYVYLELPLRNRGRELVHRRSSDAHPL